LLDRVNDLGKLFHSNGTESDKDVSAMGKIKDLFVCVRDLQFTLLSNELTEEGFLADLMETLSGVPSENQEKEPKAPQDHKKKQK
jgi:hypothetical protein